MFVGSNVRLTDGVTEIKFKIIFQAIDTIARCQRSSKANSLKSQAPSQYLATCLSRISVSYQ